jgi:8-oxo-dGTP pyrophosphatase MutT (NUDIX family)
VRGLALAFATLAYGCETVAPARPYGSFVEPPTLTGNAGCLIQSQGRTLLLVHRPGGQLGFPGGTAQSGESAQRTAQRETWEETGLDVDVRSLVMAFDNGFLLFECTPNALFSKVSAPPLPSWAKNEISEMVWADLDSIDPGGWRFPEQLEEVKSTLRRPRTQDDGSTPTPEQR